MKDTYIHIGYHKTATTYLQKEIFKNIESAFDVRYDIITEKIVYPNDFLFDKTIAYKYFEDIRVREGIPLILSCERLAGNPKSGGYDQVKIANRLKELFPEAKIIIIIRKQVDLIYSNYKQYVKEGGIKSIKKFIKETKPEWWPEFSKEYFNYSYLIQYYHHLFSKENVKVLLYEELLSDQKSFLLKLGSFMHIDIKSNENDRNANKSFSDISISLLRVLNPMVYGRWHGDNYVFPIINIKVFRRFLFFIDKIFRLTKIKFLKNKIRKMIGDYYNEDNLKLGEIIVENKHLLKKYGYINE